MKKKKIIIIICFLILVLAISICILLNTKSNTELQIIKNPTFEVNSKVKNTKLLKNAKNITIKEENIDTSKLGKNKYNIKYKIRTKTKKQTIEYKIIDTIKPKIKSDDKIELNINDELKLSEIATVTDNSKEEIKIKIEGNYEVNKAGEYKVKFVAEDSSKNKTEKDFTIIVKENKEEPTNSDSIESNNEKPTDSNIQQTPSTSQNNSDDQLNSDDEYDSDYLMKKSDQLFAEGKAYGSEIKQKVWTYVPDEINSHIPGATYPIYEANFYWQYIKYGTMEPGDGTIVDLYEWRVQTDMDEYFDVTGRPQMVHRNGAQSYLEPKPSADGYPNEKVGNVHLYYTNGIGFYETKKYIAAGR